MVLARQVLDGVGRAVLNYKGSAEIEIRLDRIRSLLRQYNKPSGLGDKSIDAFPSCNHDPERDVETLPKDEPIEAMREPLVAK
ncbi:MAG TPA: hypothetical protein VFW94_09190, partial [Candidatus Acidoferrales bacterium]|nr:hypothetical protein [Candidatus Acidoferrales bacterium]